MGGVGEEGVVNFFLKFNCHSIAINQGWYMGGAAVGGVGGKIFFVEIQLPFICHSPRWVYGGVGGDRF